MGVSCGIVGLPNVGKSTLFNALSAAGAEVANYPFCTIEPNVGVVPVPDARLDALVALYHPKSVVAATVNFVDIAGLVRGASKGEGLGNQFLANIRETDAIAHVVRCFEDENIVHVEGRIDPVADVATIDTELCLKDLDTVDKRIERAKKALKGPASKDEKLILELCERVRVGLDAGKPARGARTVDRGTGPVERGVAPDAEEGLLHRQRRRGATGDRGSGSARREIAGARRVRERTRRRDLRRRRGRDRVPGSRRPSGFSRITGARRAGPASRRAHGLRDSRPHYVSHGRRGRVPRLDHQARLESPQAAGAIHTDFERGFIKAEVIWWEDLIRLGSEAACRSAPPS